MARLRKLPDEEAFKLLEEYNIPIPPYSIVETPEEAGLAAEKIGFPVVIKVVSPDISHKSDVGGVVVGLNSALEVVEAARRMLERVRERARCQDYGSTSPENGEARSRGHYWGATRPRFQCNTNVWSWRSLHGATARRLVPRVAHNRETR